MSLLKNRNIDIVCHGSAADIDGAQWNRLLTPADSPFMEWEWFAALENSGSIGIESGWQALHVAVYERGVSGGGRAAGGGGGNRGGGQQGEVRDGTVYRRGRSRLLGVAPLYCKRHSWGELVFDHGWQQLAAEAGAEYFPKLVGMIPATPCTGYRFLCDPRENQQELVEIIFSAINSVAQQVKAKTVAFHFVLPEWQERFRAHGYSPWVQTGFSWNNAGYSTYADYTGRFGKNLRRNIRREREAVTGAGYTVDFVRGHHLTRRYLERMHEFYCNTNSQFGPFAAHFLNDRFFQTIAATFAHRLVLCCAFPTEQMDLPVARRDPVGMSMLLHKNDQLYGRYWGRGEDIDKLHFELCYYAPIEWAIRNHCSFFDPGIGGEHKVRRGLHADARCTLLRFTDPSMAHYLSSAHERINQQTEEHIAVINAELPYRKDQAAGAAPPRQL